MTLRLLRLAESNWDTFDGWCASQGVNPIRLPMHRFLSLIYFWATREADELQLQKFDIRLWIPPKDVVPEEGPWTAEAEMSAFRNLATSLNIDPKTTDEVV